MKFVRNQNVTFSKSLVDSSGLVTPISDVQCRIFNPSGEQVATGVANLNLDTSLYDFQFIVPPNAEYSTLENSWRVSWNCQLTANRVFELIDEFDVVSNDLTLPERTFILAEQSEDEYIEFLIQRPYSDLKLEVFSALNEKISSRILTTADYTSTQSENGYHILLEWPTINMVNGEYLFKLSYLDTLTNRRLNEMTVGNVVPNVFWRLYPSLQLFLDKIRKPANLVMSHSTSDYFEYIKRGLAICNAAAPQITGWTLEGFPVGGSYWGGHDLSHHLISASALWALQSQSLLNAEMNFNFSGQTINLGYDGSLAGVMEPLLADVNTRLPNAKELLLRATTATANVGIRFGFAMNGLSRIDMLRRGLDIRLNYLNQPISTHIMV